jgi:hypothetical protein
MEDNRQLSQRDELKKDDKGSTATKKVTIMQSIQKILKYPNRNAAKGTDNIVYLKKQPK